MLVHIPKCLNVRDRKRTGIIYEDHQKSHVRLNMGLPAGELYFYTVHSTCYFIDWFVRFLRLPPLGLNLFTSTFFEFLLVVQDLTLNIE